MTNKRLARFLPALGAIGTVAVALAAAASPAGATTIGQIAPDNPPGTPPPATAISGPFDEIQETVTSGTSYVVPAGATRITSWSTNAAEGTGQQLEFKVFRYVSGPDKSTYTYMAVAHDLETLTPSTINTFAVNLAVQPGDLIGLNDENASAHPSAATFSNPSPGDRTLERTTMGDLGDGLNGTFVETNARLNVSAEVSGPSVGPSPSPGPSPPPMTITPPTTTIDAHPKAKVKTHTKKTKVSFSFSSNEVGSTFMCMLDKGNFSPCASSKTYKVKSGKHTFSVEATNTSGQTGTAVSFHFKVVRK